MSAPLSSKASALSVTDLERRHWCRLRYNDAVPSLPTASILAAEQQAHVFLGARETQEKQLLVLRPGSHPASSRKPSLENSRSQAFGSPMPSGARRRCPSAGCWHPPTCLRPGLNKVAFPCFTVSPRHGHLPDPLGRCGPGVLKGGPPSPSVPDHKVLSPSRPAASRNQVYFQDVT